MRKNVFVFVLCEAKITYPFYYWKIFETRFFFKHYPKNRCMVIACIGLSLQLPCRSLALLVLLNNSTAVKPVITAICQNQKLEIFFFVFISGPIYFPIPSEGHPQTFVP